jgi:hypothetical protein
MDFPTNVVKTRGYLHALDACQVTLTGKLYFSLALFPYETRYSTAHETLNAGSLTR